MMYEYLSSRRAWLASTGLLLGGLSWLSGCSTPKKEAPVVVTRVEPLRSAARTEREYRQDMARHLYQRNAARIYKGKLPPLLYAIGVTRLSISPEGEVLDIDWMRQPKHAPEVIAEIERTIRAAAPYPVAAALPHQLYTETWLWDKSGRFQLDSLTEGQA